MPRAAAASIARIFACAWGLRTKQACSVPARARSPTKRARPVSKAGSSRRATRAPKCFAPMVRPRNSANGARRYTERIALQLRAIVRYGGRLRVCHARRQRRGKSIRAGARRGAARFPGASRRARGAWTARARRTSDQQRYRAAPAGALAVFRRARGKRAARVSVHERGGFGRPPLRDSGRGRRACRFAAHLCVGRGPACRGNRGGLAARDRQSAAAGRGWVAAVPSRDHQGR